MANYRRLISYIYAYEGEVKGKNIGFAKLESRGGQCKLSVNVKKVYVGGSDLGVYLLAPGKEIHLGGIFIRGGAGEFRSTVSVENAADSGVSMDSCYGLSIHEPNDSWRAYTTIWEDAVAHAAELELADVTSKNRRGSTDEDEIHKKAEEIAAEMERETAGTPESKATHESKTTQQNLKADAGSEIRAEASGNTEAGKADAPRASGSFAEAEYLDAASVQEAETQQENNPADSAKALAAKAGDESAQEHAASGKNTDTGAVEAAETAAADPSGLDKQVINAEAEKAGAAAEHAEAAAESKTLKAEETIFPENGNNGAGGTGSPVMPEQSGPAHAGYAKPWTVQQDSIRQQLLFQSRQMYQQPGARPGIRSGMESNESMTAPASWHAGRVMQPGPALNPRQTPPYERAEGAQAGANPQQSLHPEAMQPRPVPQDGRQSGGENQGAQHNSREMQDNTRQAQDDGKEMQDNARQIQDNISSRPSLQPGAVPLPQPGEFQPRPGQPSLLTPAGRPMQPGRPGMPGVAAGQPHFGQMQPQPPGGNSRRQPMQPVQPPVQPDHQPIQSAHPPMQPTQPPMQPAHQPMQPTQPPMQTDHQPMQPDQPPMQPDHQPIQPAQPPMQPDYQPMQSTQPPMQPAHQPMQPTQPPMQPDHQPMQPAHQPMQPTQPPMQPDHQPMQSTQPLMQPSQQSMQPARQPMQTNQPSRQPVRPPRQQNRPPMPPAQPGQPSNQQNHQPIQPARQTMLPGQPPTQPTQLPAPPQPPAQHHPSAQHQPPTPPSRPAMPPGRRPMQPARRPMQPPRRPMQSAPAPDNTQSVPSPAPAPTLESQLPDVPEEKEPVIISGQDDLNLGDPKELERLDQEERSNMQPQQLWDRFRKQYPKIQAFDCNGGCEILTIKPQDIGLLPRETWTYGNNSFLLHGYYNYRYLILAKVENTNSGGSRYLLGVPGNYYSNEKYMASMFGFPHFVLAKKQPTHNGRFGYWYTDIKLDNVN